ncbi:MAG: uracil-DNA glycosylase family protein [Muribaculaceae bacterium]|nr:uracil-DNA glycosylase family protein [Muribaculaceae bacterium]
MDKEIEIHPFQPYIPPQARVLIMGTFPPQPKRWSMEFYYPNRSNDFWFMMGLIFSGDRYALYDTATRTFRLDDIKALLNREGIALSDTGYRIHRQAGNASDKFLEIIEPVNLDALLAKMPQCHTIATTGEKAAGVIAQLTDTVAPRMGEMVTDARGIEIWRMPSTSRAYPVSLEKKAEPYARMFSHLGMNTKI